MRRFKHLRIKDRIRIETLFNEKEPIKKIADKLGVHQSTVYRELKRGRYIKLNTHLEEKVSYSPDIAEMRYRANLAAKGVELKIGQDREYANYIEKKIRDDNYSPEAVLGEIKAKGLKFKTSICVTTLYSYIDKDVFLTITNKSLPVKKNKKRGYKKVVTREHKRLLGESIDKRPKEIDTRDDFGHWEMDTVKGVRYQKSCLLVLTERKTRKEYVFKLLNQGAAAVVEKLDQLEKKWGSLFSKVFKTITMDNGVEFSFYDLMKRSIFDENTDRTKMFYCHPYSSFERGSNEVQNKLIRRHLPKKTNFDDKTDKDIQAIEDWINKYPRRMFGFQCADDLFQKELSMLY